VYIAAHLVKMKEASMFKAALSSLLTCLLLILTVPAWAADKGKDEETIKNAATVLQAMLSSKAVPDSLLVTADCIIVLPSVKKFAVGVGGSGGRGAMTCRDKNFTGSKWSAPAMVTIGGASAGAQIGASSTDFVLLIMAPAAVNKVLAGKVKVGTDVTAAAGPAATTVNAVGGADVLTYGRAKGLFAGISLDGASLEPDSNADQRLYDKSVSASQIVVDNAVQPTPAGQALIAVLDSRDWH
jgi:lipid-binding SYLF domain-containing protein